MKTPVYLDYSATTPCDPRVVEHFAGTATTLWADIDTEGLATLTRTDPPRMQALLARARPG